jgi:hypothetical protein
MTTATATPLPVSKNEPGRTLGDSPALPAAATSQSTTKTKPTTEERAYWGDWVALVFWVTCFVLMGMIHVKDLIVSMFR